jgi:hypothetical protein
MSMAVCDSVRELSGGLDNARGGHQPSSTPTDNPSPTHHAAEPSVTARRIHENVADQSVEDRPAGNALVKHESAGAWSVEVG